MNDFVLLRAVQSKMTIDRWTCFVPFRRLRRKTTTREVLVVQELVHPRGEHIHFEFSTVILSLSYKRPLPLPLHRQISPRRFEVVLWLFLRRLGRNTQESRGDLLDENPPW